MFAEPVEYVPPVHAVHVDAPVPATPVADPAPHCEHAAFAEAAEYDPAEQGTQVEVLAV